MNCSAHCSGVRDMFDTRTAQRDLRRYQRKGPAKTTRLLIDAVAQRGVAGRTFLDVGGGVGAIQHELAARGADGGTNVDASPAYLAVARAEAEKRGYAHRVKYVEGDFVARAPDLARADLVTLDRVVCCYPDMPALLGAAAPLSRRAIGLVFPRRTPLTRCVVALVNLIQRLRRHPFRAYVHHPADIERVLGRHGLSRRFLHDGLVWRVAVFAPGNVP